MLDLFDVCECVYVCLSLGVLDKKLRHVVRLSACCLSSSVMQGADDAIFFSFLSNSSHFSSSPFFFSK